MSKNKKETSIEYYAIAYYRLSKDDRGKNESDSIANQRKLIETYLENNPNINVFTGLEFSNTDFSMNNLPIEQQQYLASLSKEELAKIVATYTENSSATYDSNLLKLGIFDLSDPSSIELYPKDFESKDEIVNVINKYNELCINLTTQNKE